MADCAVNESQQIIKHLEQIDKHLVGLMILFFGIALVVLFVAAYVVNTRNQVKPIDREKLNQ